MAAGLVAVICGGHDDGAVGAPASVDLLEPGRLDADELAETEGHGTCRDGDTLHVNVAASWPCPDDTEVTTFAGWGWGITGGEWQGPDVPEPYTDCVLPGTDPQHP